MNVIREGSVGRNYKELLMRCLEGGRTVSPRGKPTRELTDVVSAVHGGDEPMVLRGRTNLGYLATEMAWYLSADRNPDRVAAHAKMWDNCRNPDGTVNSNYGASAFNEHPLDFAPGHEAPRGTEWDWCRQSLIDDPDSRQAVIVIHRPGHHWRGNRDLPCTLNVRFRIEDGHLVTRAHMRSCDLWWGFPYDSAWFQLLHRGMRAELRKDMVVGPGEVRLQMDSAHIYQRHWMKAAALASGPGIPETALTGYERLEQVRIDMEKLSQTLTQEVAHVA